MQPIIDLFSTIGSAISTALEFTGRMVGDLATLFEMLGQITAILPSFWVWLPAGLAGTLAVTFIIVIILRILGRAD